MIAQLVSAGAVPDILKTTVDAFTLCMLSSVLNIPKHGRDIFPGMSRSPKAKNSYPTPQDCGFVDGSAPSVIVSSLTLALALLYSFIMQAP